MRRLTDVWRKVSIEAVLLLLLVALVSVNGCVTSTVLQMRVHALETSHAATLAALHEVFPLSVEQCRSLSYGPVWCMPVPENITGCVCHNQQAPLYEEPPPEDDYDYGGEPSFDPEDDWDWELDDTDDWIDL